MKMAGHRHVSFMIICLFLIRVSVSAPNDTEPLVLSKSDHPLGKYWIWQTTYTFFGVLLNGSVLILVISERRSMITIVNAMLWWNSNCQYYITWYLIFRIDTFYRLLISVVFIPWKAYLMSTNSTVLQRFISLELVSAIKYLVIHCFSSSV